MSSSNDNNNSSSSAAGQSTEQDTSGIDKTGWGDDDMSAGERLKRYNIKDDDGDDGDDESSTPQQTTTASSTTATTSSPVADDIIFAGPFNQLINDVLFDLATRHSNEELLTKIQQFHPEENYDSTRVSWRLDSAIKTRVARTGEKYADVRKELDDKRIENGVGGKRGKASRAS